MQADKLLVLLNSMRSRGEELTGKQVIFEKNDAARTAALGKRQRPFVGKESRSDERHSLDFALRCRTARLAGSFSPQPGQIRRCETLTAGRQLAVCGSFRRRLPCARRQIDLSECPRVIECRIRCLLH